MKFRHQFITLDTLLTYLLTPWCRVLLEKLTGLQLVKKFPPFHGTRRFITALPSVRHLSLSWASPIQSIYPHPTSWRSILILSTHQRLGLPSGLLPSGFPTKTLYTPSPHPHAPHAHPISFSILSPAQYWVRSPSHLAPRHAISPIPLLPRPTRAQSLAVAELWVKSQQVGVQLAPPCGTWQCWRKWIHLRVRGCWCDSLQLEVSLAPAASCISHSS